MDKIQRKTAFGQWFSPINSQGFEEDVKAMECNRYIQKLIWTHFLNLMLFAQVKQSNSLYDLRVAFFNDDFQKEVNLESSSVSQLSRRIKVFKQIFIFEFNYPDSSKNQLSQNFDAIKIH